MESTSIQSQYSAALVAAIGELQDVAKTASNPYFKSKYAPLDAIVEATRPVLAKHGLAIQQFPLFMEGSTLVEITDKNGNVTKSPIMTAGVETTILHKAGHFTTTTLLLPLKDQSPQGVGSAITYARRYSLAAVLGLATEDDDDGNASTGLTKKEDARPAVAQAMDRSPVVKPAGSPIATWREVLPVKTKIAAKNKEGSPKVWTLYGIEFSDNGKIIEAMTFDEKLYASATKFGEEGIFVDAGVAAGKKDPSKWELVTITASENQNK